MIVRPGYAGLFVSLIAAFGVCLSASAGDNNLNEPPEGFRALFNGKNLENWRGQIAEDPRDIAKITNAMTPQQIEQKQKEADEKSFQHWTAEQGVIHYDGTPRIGNIETREEYGDFEMYIDWKIPKGGDTLWVKLNGELVVDGKKKGNYWKEFKQPPPAKGPIVLQSHGSDLWFRNVFIRRLKAAR